MKKILTSFVMGIGIGQFFYIACLYIFKAGAQPPQTILMVAVISGFMGLAGLIYDLPKLPILAKSLLHFSMIALLVVAVNLAMGYRFHLSLAAIVGFLGSFALIYLLIWVVLYWVEKKKIEAINDRLN